MFDFHMHSSLSFDSEAAAKDMVNAAARNGLREICFTDHYDCHFYPDGEHWVFTDEEYGAAYDTLTSDKVSVRRGVELGLTAWNRPQFEEVLARRPLDFVLGSVHFARGTDPYFPEYWDGITVEQAFEEYLTETLRCVRLHDGFDVLGHLTYVCKSPHNREKRVVQMADYQDIVDAIFKELVQKGIGLEVNTSGVDRLGVLLPDVAFIKRFKELGGEIVTVGSDAHAPDRVGNHINDALAVLRDIFGYVCTFENRKPIFHKL
ncbi:MAG: histidinol-phosphatase HisJ family protein [Clostridia bacterium]|nr:histidinol-phosphatase HisJ family protein [Clostridia bacterium]